MRIKIRKLPGSKSKKYLDKVKKFNLGWNNPYPFVHSDKGEGCYFQDIDGNIFLDFASQIAANPLGYNHPDILKVIKKYSNRHPIKFAGQDFTVKEHIELLEELLKIAPRGFDRAFLINSGAEAVENSLKTALRYSKGKFGVSFEGAFHGRTMGALSFTHSKPIQKKNFLEIPNKTLPFSEKALDILEKMNPGFVIIEIVQGEGGYNLAPRKLIKGIRKITREKNIPLIFDEVQSGMGRTGKWFAFEHYKVKPDIFSAAKALQVGATITSKKFDLEPGSISSTWGGGHILDLAVGLQTIKIIKKDKLLHKNRKNGEYLKKRLNELSLINVRGLGLMVAFDLQTKEIRDNLVIELLKNGLVVLGCGKKGIRLIPPYIVTEKEIDQAVDIIEKAVKKVSRRKFKHKGDICNYLDCGQISS